MEPQIPKSEPWCRRTVVRNPFFPVLPVVLVAPVLILVRATLEIPLQNGLTKAMPEKIGPASGAPEELSVLPLDLKLPELEALVTLPLCISNRNRKPFAQLQLALKLLL